MSGALLYSALDLYIHTCREECQTNDEAMNQYELMQKVCCLRQEKAELEKSSGILYEGNRLVAY